MVDGSKFKVQGSRFDLSEIEGFTVHDSRLTVHYWLLFVDRKNSWQLMVDVFWTSNYELRIMNYAFLLLTFLLHLLSFQTKWGICVEVDGWPFDFTQGKWLMVDGWWFTVHGLRMMVDIFWISNYELRIMNYAFLLLTLPFLLLSFRTKWGICVEVDGWWLMVHGSRFTIHVSRMMVDIFWISNYVAPSKARERGINMFFETFL